MIFLTRRQHNELLSQVTDLQKQNTHLIARNALLENELEDLRGRDEKDLIRKVLLDWDVEEGQSVLFSRQINQEEIDRYAAEANKIINTPLIKKLAYVLIEKTRTAAAENAENFDKLQIYRGQISGVDLLMEELKKLDRFHVEKNVPSEIPQD